MSAQRALDLDPKSSWGYVIRATVHYLYDWDWAAAERDAREAVHLKPNDPASVGVLGLVYQTLGRWDKSTPLIETAVGLDPLDPFWHMPLSWLRYSTGKLGEAEAEVRKVLELSPTYENGHSWLGHVLLAQGKLEAALAEMQQDNSNSGVARVYFAMGQRAKSDAALAELIQKHANDNAYDIAQAYAYRRDLDDAFAWLERAYRQRDFGLTDLKSAEVDPLVKDFANDPRFAAFLRKMNLPP